MEIYLLREEKEVGPYGADDVRSWLDDGQVSASELAWSPGLESWVPLQTLLDPQAEVHAEAEAEMTPEPEAPAPEPVVAKPILKPLPRATAEQKAFLSYMGASFAPEITSAEAEHRIEELSHDRGLAARRARWDEEKLDLHPEMFAEEVKARRANRPGYFHKLVQTEGGDCFTGVTKAHCQVLVGYLDVNHPRWDANMRDAAWHYFFPAIAEKFPQLVHKEWRPKLKYKEGPKVAPELLEPKHEPLTAAERARRGRLISRAVTAAVLLGVAGTAFAAWKSPTVSMALKTRAASLGTQLMTVVRGDEPRPAGGHAFPDKVPPAPTDTPAVTPPEPSAAETDAPKIASTTETAVPSTEMKPTDPAMAPAETKPEMKEGMAPATEGTPPVAMKPTEGLFDPKANAPASLPPIPGMATGAVSAPKTEARLKQPIQVPSKYGVITLNIGTALKIVSREGDWLTLNHMGQAIRVPASSTDVAQ